MVLVRSAHSRDQDFINSKLRPSKQRFPRGSIPGAQLKMKNYGAKKLRTYKPQLDFRAPLYYSFTTERMEPNFFVPREGRSVRITVIFPTRRGAPFFM